MVFRKQINIIAFYTGITALVSLAGCSKWVDAGDPRTELYTPVAFSSDALAEGAIAAIYADMRDGYAAGFQSLSPYMGASADEMQSFMSNEFFTNDILPASSTVAMFWDGLYKTIMLSNAALEGIGASTGISAPAKKQLSGEALFLRAFAYFYLVNMYGDVPLLLTSDHRINAVATRMPASKVYEQVVADLKEAQLRLAPDYAFCRGEKVRANQWVATALLARVYLYMRNWRGAEEQATAVINQSSLYRLGGLNTVFLKNSSEAIWQLSFVNQDPNDRLTLYNVIPGLPPIFASFSSAAAASFEAGDQRKSQWLATSPFAGITYWIPVKYKGTAVTASAITEYSMVMRLAEQYLVRAEARTHRDNLTGSGSASEDVNTIRNRAGLGDTDARDAGEMLLAIENERRHELFVEWGHRWLDLKRTGRATAVLAPVKAGWESYKELYPIPQSQLDNDPAMAEQQNPGYTK